MPNTYKHRQKRGLFNPFGTFIKAITGNLDENDYVEIKNSIQKLDDGRYEVLKKFDDQIKLNQQLINQNQDIIDQVNEVTIRQVQTWTSIARNTEKEVAEATYFNGIFKGIEDAISIVQDQVNEIHEILTFAKINVISKHILDNTEMEYVTTELYKDNIKFHSEEQIYSLLGIKAFYNNTDLVVLVEIPQFTNEPTPYYLYKILTYPVNNQIIIQNYNYLISNTENYMIVNTICPTLEQVFICEKLQIYQSKGQCIPELIQNKNTSCHTQEIQPKEEVTQIEPGYVYISSPKGTTITTTCASNQEARITGTKLIKSDQCSISIKNTRYTNTKIVHRQKPTIIQPMDNIDVNITMTELLDLPLLTKQTIQNLDKISLEHRSSRNIQYSYGITSIIIIFIVLIILFILHRKIRSIFSNLYHDNQGAIKCNEDRVAKAPMARRGSLDLRREELCTIPDTSANPTTTYNPPTTVVLHGRKSTSANNIHFA